MLRGSRVGSRAGSYAGSDDGNSSVVSLSRGRFSAGSGGSDAGSATHSSSLSTTEGPDEPRSLEWLNGGVSDPRMEVMRWMLSSVCFICEF